MQKSEQIKPARSDVSLKQAVAAMRAQIPPKAQLSTTSRATSQMSIVSQRKDETPQISAEQLQEISFKQEKIGKEQERLVKATKEELSERIHALEESIQGNLK